MDASRSSGNSRLPDSLQESAASLLGARTTFLHLQIQHHARELSWQAHRQAAGGGVVAAWGVTQEFQILDQLLRDLDRVDAALRTCEGERRYLASLLRDWGDA